MRSPIGERDGSDEAELEFQTPVLKRLRISMDGAYFLPSIDSTATRMRICGVI
jgi:hypothetical protein